jgi:RimJ/RimL family protein N-acetyltransferase
MSKARRIVASVRTINPASRLVLERNGFHYTHDSEPFMPARNSAQKVHWFKLERDEWATAGRANVYKSAIHAVS